MSKGFYHGALTNSDSHNEEIVKNLGPFAIKGSHGQKDGRMAEKKFLFSGPCIHDIFKETAERNFKTRHRCPVIAASADEYISHHCQNAKAHQKAKTNLDTAELLYKADKILVRRNGLPEERKFLDIHNRN